LQQATTIKKTEVRVVGDTFLPVACHGLSFTAANLRQSAAMPAPGRLLIVLTVSLLILIWGTTLAAIAISLRGIPPLTGVALRFAVAALVLLGVSRAMGLGPIS
jgi:hypothetical protein